MACQMTVIGTNRGRRGGVPLSSELVEEEIPRSCNQTRSKPSGQHDYLSQGDTGGVFIQLQQDG